MSAVTGTMATATSPVASLAIMMRALKLPTVARHAEEVAQKAEREGWTFGQYLHHLAELEIHERRRRRTERYLKESDLLPEMSGLAPIADKVASLDLARTKVSDAGLAKLAAMKNLQELHLENTGIGDAGLDHLKGLASLEYLNLYNTKVTDAGLAKLSEVQVVDEIGGTGKRVAVITSASSIPEEVGANYIEAFGRLGVKDIDILDIRGEVVIGEGIKDNAPGIFIGEHLGTWRDGSPRFNIALDPIDGTFNYAAGSPMAAILLPPLAYVVLG